MKIRERIRLAIVVVVLSLLLIIRDVFNIELSKYIYLVFVAASLAVVKYSTMVYMLCFIFPLVCGLPGTYIMPYALAMMMFKNKSVNIWQIGLLIFIACAEILASFWYPMVKTSIMVQYISFAGVMFYLIHDKTELDYLQCIKMYMLGVVFLCAVIITTGVIYAPSNWQELFTKGEFRFGATQMDKLEGMTLSVNANSLAYYSLTGVCCGALLMERAKGKGRALYLSLTIVPLVTGLLTVSRSWVLVLIICLLIYIFSKAKHPKKLLTVLAIVALMIVIFSLVVGGMEDFIAAFTTRLNEENMVSGGGRTNLFVAYTEAFLSDVRVMLFGSGVTQYLAVLGVGQSMHNGTQQIIVCYGLLGFVFIMIGLIKPIVGIHMNGKREMVYWLPLIGIVLFVQTIQFLEPAMLMLPYIIGVYALKAGGASNEEIHNNGGHRR